MDPRRTASNKAPSHMPKMNGDMAAGSPDGLLVCLHCTRRYDDLQNLMGMRLVDRFRQHPKVACVVDSSQLNGREADIALIMAGSYLIGDAIKVAALCRSAVTVEISREPYSLKALCDWSFGHGPSDERHMLHPGSVLAMLLLRPELAVQYGVHGAREAPKTRFCHFLYTNPHGTERVAFARRLLREHPVDCLGPVLNNAPKIPRTSFADTVRMLSPYKFGIAFENHMRPGYTSEKIMQCFLAGNVPVYWGNPEVAQLFNPAAFINCHDFANLEEAAKHVAATHSNPEMYARYRSAPPILPDSPLARSMGESLGRRVEEVIDSVGRLPRASAHPLYALRWVAACLRIRHYCLRHIARRPAWYLLPAMAKYALWDSMTCMAKRQGQG